MSWKDFRGLIKNNLEKFTDGTIFDGWGLNNGSHLKVSEGENQAYHEYLERDFEKYICHMTYHVTVDR